MLASLNVPRSNRAVITRRDYTPLVVIEAHICHEVGVTSILFDPCRRLRAVQHDLVLVDRGGCDVLIVEGGCDVKHCLVQA